MTLGGILLGIIAIFFPPAAVIVRRGCHMDLVINIILLFLAWIPGIVHAWYIIATYPSLRQRHRRARERRRSQLIGTRSPSMSVISHGSGYTQRRSSSRRRSTSRNPSVIRHERVSRSYHRDDAYPGGRTVYYPPVTRKY
ncbi:unnamed protein product [Zymoseptoria tritici ST99CH_1A5]|uniref:Stress response RCI peptide n=4 Tax=Zymoseptoria tritici TaxID=1047171 RepID=F9X3X1_ZYMTI|nr:uncharacterized protein MYCGRDRAFT_90987 [Zymoseptoria tritici IPO323]EGP90052.1 hypothetical protein MYCGRDRAFT_90987 [Zymoseptoria tritici IPO323]SMQ47923.1 unnamed protein product [Zymoseptoria tritici ST99CH_3D7]SMR46459.1 unnamed protein product [Zymoseptoria tritici ST99CH_1E4]SMY21610.1 unnamed protein product [Zymoseptoria tritici ST99CH_1A5]